MSGAKHHNSIILRQIKRALISPLIHKKTIPNTARNCPTTSVGTARYYKLHNIFPPDKIIITEDKKVVKW